LDRKSGAEKRETLYGRIEMGVSMSDCGKSEISKRFGDYGLGDLG